MAYIYLITNLITQKIYIGQTNGKRKDYFAGGKIIKQSIRKYGKENFSKDILISGDFTRVQLHEQEKQYILLFNSTDPEIGYNLTLGGEGSEGYKYPKEVLEKRSNSMKKTYADRGYFRTPEQIEKTASKHRGRKYGEEFKKKCRDRMLGYIIPEEQRLRIKESVRKHYYKEFEVYDLKGNYINTFGIINDAVKELGLKNSNKSGINRALRGKQSHCQSFIFKYKEVSIG